MENNFISESLLELERLARELTEVSPPPIPKKIPKISPNARGRWIVEHIGGYRNVRLRASYLNPDGSEVVATPFRRERLLKVDEMRNVLECMIFIGSPESERWEWRRVD